MAVAEARKMEKGEIERSINYCKEKLGLGM